MNEWKCCICLGFAWDSCSFSTKEHLKNYTWQDLKRCQLGYWQETESNLEGSRDTKEGEMYGGWGESHQRGVLGHWDPCCQGGCFHPGPGAAVEGQGVSLVLGQQEPQGGATGMEGKSSLASLSTFWSLLFKPSRKSARKRACHSALSSQGVKCRRKALDWLSQGEEGQTE